MDNNKQLANLCLRQWIRNKLGEILLSNKNSDNAINEINDKMIKDFLVIAKDEIKKTFDILNNKPNK